MPVLNNPKTADGTGDFQKRSLIHVNNPTAPFNERSVAPLIRTI